MQNPWDVRPRADKGDEKSETLFQCVGAALSAWEALESIMAEVFDAMVAAQPSNRAAFASFAAVKSASARHELLEAAAARAIPKGDPAHDDVAGLITAFGKFGARRNEIAHGIVFDLGEHGLYLAPNNVMRHKWANDGTAKYQYVAEDIAYYAVQFGELREKANTIKEALIQRDIAARKTKRTRSAWSKS